MKVLPTAFTEKGCRYTQLAREGMVALYAQQGAEWKTPRYEVIVIRIAKEHVWPTGAVSPEAETYPSARRWGQDGWTFHSEADARAHLSRLVAQRTTSALGAVVEVCDRCEQVTTLAYAGVLPATCSAGWGKLCGPCWAQVQEAARGPDVQ